LADPLLNEVGGIGGSEDMPLDALVAMYGLLLCGVSWE
jgi:hypothetical protein